jgi:hypothetical protein
MIDDPITRQAIPVHESAEEIEAALAAVYDLVKCQAEFDMPEQKAFVLELLSAARYSVYWLFGQAETEAAEQDASPASASSPQQPAEARRQAS